jgi:hypothetical protein
MRATSGTLTIGPSMTIRGGFAEIGVAGLPLDVQGTIRADVAGRRLTVLGTGWTNSGLIEAPGGAVTLDGAGRTLVRSSSAQPDR